MVKILQAYNFVKQNTFAINGEILAATLIDSNHVAISSAEQFIEIYDIEEEKPLAQSVCNVEYQTQVNSGIGVLTANGGNERQTNRYSLPTVGDVVNLIYCSIGKYLVTLEKEPISSPVRNGTSSIGCTSGKNATMEFENEPHLFVRIYTNFWRFTETKLIDLQISVRIASMTTPKASVMNNIDVIELPLRNLPNLVQCCPTSGNIIVSSKERIYLYEFTQCVYENTQPRFKYIDFLPFKFYVNLNFVPLKLCLAENVIACMNKRYCVAFRVVDVLTCNPRLKIKSCGNHDKDYCMPLEDNISPVASSGRSKASTVLSTHSHNNSFEADSLESSDNIRQTNVGLHEDTPIDFNVACKVNSVFGHEFIVDLKSQWDMKDKEYQSKSINTKLVSGYESQDIFIRPTRANEVKIKLINEANVMNEQRISNKGKIMSAYTDDGAVQYDIRKLLQICMRTEESGGAARTIDILRCMHLKAIYRRNDNDSDNMNIDPEYEMGNQQQPGIITTFKHINRRTLKSHLHQNCIGYALLVASSVDGYLYQFSSEGKWHSENEKPIAMYSFTAPVLQVHINDYVIYAITAESVEVHTSRVGHKLYNNRFEYPTLAEQFPDDSSPDPNIPIAMIGLCAFVHVQFVCVNRNKLILISNSALSLNNNTMDTLLSDNTTRTKHSIEIKRNLASRFLAEAKAKHLLRLNGSHHNQLYSPGWTVYDLKIPGVEQVVDDLENIAQHVLTETNKNFYDLMEEAHVILRMSISLQFEEKALRESNLTSKFIENCRKLANFCIKSTKKEIYMQAPAFYMMCDTSLLDIYSYYVKSVRDDSNSHCNEKSLLDIPTVYAKPHGFIYTIKIFLLSIKAYSLNTLSFHQLVKPYFTQGRGLQGGRSKVTLAMEILYLFIHYSPGDISQIMLDSIYIADAVSTHLINYLTSRVILSSDEKLLLAVISCRMSNYTLSKDIVTNLSRYDLVRALIKHKNVLFDDNFILYQENKPSNYRDGAYLDVRPRLRNSWKSLSDQQIQGDNIDATIKGSCDYVFNQEVLSFSDFCESILLAIEKPYLIEAISDVFIHALCVERSLNLELILHLFLNFIATHISQRGYHTSQKVLVNILQVYYYDLIDVNHFGSQISDITSSSMEIQRSDEVNNVDGHIFTNSGTIEYERDHNDYGGLPEHLKKKSNDRDTESVSNSNKDSISVEDHVTSSQHLDSILYDQLLEQNSSHKCNSNNSLFIIEHNCDFDNEITKKGLKILFRMYLSQLKFLSEGISAMDTHISSGNEQLISCEEILSLRIFCVALMARHVHEIRNKFHKNQLLVDFRRMQRRNVYGTNFQTLDGNRSSRVVGECNVLQKRFVFIPYIPNYKLTSEEFEKHVKNYIRPVPCLLDRPQYLNHLPPFQRDDFSYPVVQDDEGGIRFIAWENQLLTATLKIQSLLASPGIYLEIIDEFVDFIQKNPNLLGIDSFLTIILPKHFAINYMITFAPEYLWNYGKSNNFAPNHWESLLRKIWNKNGQVANWKRHITRILDHLVDDLNFKELLHCFPNEVIRREPNMDLWQFESEFTTNCIANIVSSTRKKICSSTTDFYYAQLKNISRNHGPMDNVNESNVFELVLRKAVSKQRSIALNSMIESTGKQLFDATNSSIYNL